ncbi:MAG: hypothetical protein KDA79_16245 [Planctomycetaceae bacterium]|nr:hypothetical protein [Planctomycetaceae bacterium]
MIAPNASPRTSVLELAVCTAFACMYAGSLVPLAMLADALRSDESQGIVVLNAVPLVSLMVVIATLSALLSLDRSPESEDAASSSSEDPAAEETLYSWWAGTLQTLFVTVRRLVQTLANRGGALQLLVFYVFVLINVLSTTFLSDSGADGFVRTGFPLVYREGGGFAGLFFYVPFRMSVNLLIGIWVSRMAAVWLIRRSS